MNNHLSLRVAAACCIGVLGIAVSIGSGCESTPEAAEESSEPATPEGTWKLTQLGGKAMPAAQAAKLPTLTIADDGKVSGSGGVNRFSSSLLDTSTLPNGEFKLSPIASTRMAGPPEAMKLEMEFLNALGEADGYRIKDGALMLTKGGNVLMTLTHSK